MRFDYICNMKREFLIAILLLCAVNAVADAADKWSVPEKEVESLSRVLDNAAQHSEVIEYRLDSLKRQLRSPRLQQHKKTWTLIELSRQYRQNMTDSALRYSELAMKEAKISGIPNSVYMADLAYADALAAAGFFSQAIIRYDSLVHVVPADKESKIELMKVGRRLYSNISSYVDDDSPMADYYHNRYVECDDSLISLMGEREPLRRFIIGERLVTNGKFAAAKTVLSQLMSELDKSNNIYGMAAFQLATVYKSEGDMTQYAACLAQAAESDVICGAREGFALPALAAWLYDRGEFATAFRYINFAVEEAYKGNVRARMVSMSRWVPAIGESYRRQISASRNEWLLISIICALLLVTLGVLIFFLVREARKNRHRKRELEATSMMKDAYIGNFIGLCSTYSEKYYSLVKLVDRKISSGQSQELLKAIKSGKVGEDENETFYKEIDSVVLTLYPDFVDKINELLQPDKQVSIEGMQLTPELRIYAFVRLGVSESARIAKILNYSVNTVYAYRNRMRNRALDRDTFDQNIMRIGTD